MSLIQSILLVASYAFIGGGLKYIDQVYDANIFDKRLAWFLAIACGLLMGILIGSDIPSAIILLGIILSVGITGKIDNPAFGLVALLSLSIPLILGHPVSVMGEPAIYINLYLLAITIGMGAFDELLDWIGDKKNIKILTTRPLMKIFVFILSFFNIFSYLYLLAMLSFDSAYILVEHYSHRFINIEPVVSPSNSELSKILEKKKQRKY